MAQFPNKFVNELCDIELSIGSRGDKSLSVIREKGFDVKLGLTEYFAGAIAIMGLQKHIREYCPKDSTLSRFGNLESTEKWLQKNGGRAVFLLTKGNKNKALLAGYGWTGLEMCDQLPDHPITSAYRIGESSQGKGLGQDFVQVVVSATNNLYSKGEGIGLETWQSNRAYNIYSKVGFLLIKESEEYELRPTLDKNASGQYVQDKRLFMGYQNKLLD